MSMLTRKHAPVICSVFLQTITICAIVTWYQVSASAVLANSSTGSDFLTHLELDENYMKSMHKLLEEDTGLQEDRSRGFREPPLMDKGGSGLRFEDEPRSWSEWAPVRSNSFTEWSDWTNCVQGYRHRSRTCLASQCSGQRAESTACGTTSPTSARTFWSDWASWSSSCDNGQQFRARQCMTSDRKGYSSDCFGEATESRPCDRQISWSSWESWSPCRNGQGSANTQTRQRGCASGFPCDGFSKQTRPCSTQTETSMWSSWGVWSACSQGKRSRTRSCQGSSGCVGLAFETSSCLEPGDRQQWSSWSSWSTTSTWGSWGEWSDCNNGYQIRQRTCSSPNKCSGSRQESKSCTDPATVPSTNIGYWGAWSSCNGGYQIRYFTCTSTREQCGTTTSESRACSTDVRVITQPPTWSSWTQQTQRPQTTWAQWSPLSMQNTQTRVRPSQQQWSSWSSWSDQSTNTRTRPSQQQWGSWSSWSEQSSDTRTRPSQQQRGSWSSWSEQSTDTRTRPSQQQWNSWSSWTAQGTDTRARPSQPQWGQWSSWSSCNQGLRNRVRTCASGQCSGNAAETLTCYLQVQPVPNDPRQNGNRNSDSGEHGNNKPRDPRKDGHRDNNSGDLTYHKPIEWTHKN